MSRSDGAISKLEPQELLGPLNEIERVNAPRWLFTAGDIELLRRAPRVAVVGTRNPSSEALRRTRKLVRLLVEKNAVVVSGLAEGIDTAAHETAMEQGGKTVAVLGTPLDQCYPKKNLELQQRIMREQLAVSEFPPGAPITRSNFPRRNRTMALLVHASVIVEAGDSSGTLSQGWEALRLRRHLFVMKAVAERGDLAWPSKMMHYGASVLADSDELAEALSEIPTGDSAELAF